MSDAEVTEKFRDCAVYADWPTDKTETAIDLIWRLDELGDMRELSGCLTGGD